MESGDGQKGESGDGKRGEGGIERGEGEGTWWKVETVRKGNPGTASDGKEGLKEPKGRGSNGGIYRLARIREGGGVVVTPRR